MFKRLQATNQGKATERVDQPDQDLTWGYLGPIGVKKRRISQRPWGKQLWRCELRMWVFSRWYSHNARRTHPWFTIQIMTGSLIHSLCKCMYEWVYPAQRFPSRVGVGVRPRLEKSCMKSEPLNHLPIDTGANRLLLARRWSCDAREVWTGFGDPWPQDFTQSWLSDGNAADTILCPYIVGMINVNARISYRHISFHIYEPVCIILDFIKLYYIILYVMLCYV